MSSRHRHAVAVKRQTSGAFFIPKFWPPNAGFRLPLVKGVTLM